MNTTAANSTSSTTAAITPPQTKEKYRTLKKKFKFLVYENECYQEELRNLQRRLLKLSRDKNFLLDRLMQYEKVSDSSDDSDPPTPAPTPADPSKAKKQKKAPVKKSRSKQPSMDTNGAETAASSTAAAGDGAAWVRGRPRKGNGAGSSSDADMVVPGGNTAATGIPLTDAERIPGQLIAHYQPAGLYEQHSSPSSVATSQ